MTYKVQSQNPSAPLEQNLINEYFRLHGHTRQSVLLLPTNEYYALMVDALKYASARLAEMESRANFLRRIRLEE
jgi:hypothetical protein